MTKQSDGGNVVCECEGGGNFGVIRQVCSDKLGGDTDTIQILFNIFKMIEYKVHGRPVTRSQTIRSNGGIIHISLI